MNESGVINATWVSPVVFPACAETGLCSMERLQRQLGRLACGQWKHFERALFHFNARLAFIAHG